MTSWLAEMGVRLPAWAHLVSAGVAIIIVIVAWGIAVVAGRTLGPRAAAFWEQRAGARSEGIAARMCDLIRYLTAAILLGIALKADAWPPLPAVILGLPLGIAVALVIGGVVRGLQMPRWIAALLGLVAFVAILADALGGLTPLTKVLDEVGFTAGKMHFSVLSLLRILITILILFAAVRLVGRLANQSIRRTHGLDATQQLLAQKLVGVGLLVAAFFLGVDLLGIDLTALAVFSGAFGLAIGFGLQKTFGNLIAGIILLMDRSIKPGDIISVGESFGSVNKIGVRAVSIVTREGKEYLIPNENLMTQEVVNWSYSTRDVRIGIPVGVGYDCDIALAQRLMIEAATASKRVLDSPKPNVWLKEFGDSAVQHEIRVWISDPEAGIAAVRSEILNRLWILFRENRITLPYPQRDIHVKEWPGPPSAGS